MKLAKYPRFVSTPLRPLIVLLALLSPLSATATVDTQIGNAAFMASFFSGGNLVRNLMLATVVKGAEKLVSTFWDAWFLSAYYPRVKRMAQANSEPDIFYLAPEVMRTGKRVDQLFLNHSTQKKVQTFIMALRRAAETGNELPSMLLYGPPGTGKTQIARRLVEEGEFLVKLYSGGQLARQMQTSFEHLFSYVEKPHERKIILFFDEVEDLLKTSYGQRSDNLQTFLTARGSASRTYTVVVATNYIGKIDEAAHRRFNFHVEVGLPEYEVRAKIFTFYMDEQKRLNELTWAEGMMEDKEFIHKVSTELEGLAGAHIENVCMNVAGEAKKFHDGVVTKENVFNNIAEEKDEAKKLREDREEADVRRRDETMYRYYESLGGKSASPEKS